MDKLLKYTLEVDSNSGTASLKSFEGSLGNVGKTAASVNDQMAQGLKETQSQMSQLASGAASLGVKFTAAMTAPVLAVAGLGISFNALQEQAQIAFTTMLSSGTKASAMLSDLKDFAAKTPFEFPDLVMASQRLMAMGIAAKDVKPTLTAIGDAAAGLGGGSAMIDVLTHAIGQMSATGHVTGREIMEMSMSGVNALQMLADGFSVSTEKMQKMVSEGAVPAGQAIKILVAGMEQQFGGMMANQSQTFNGLVSTIKDESRFLAGELTDGLFNALKGPAQTAADSIHALRVEMGSWSDESKTAVLVTAGLAAGIGPLLLGIGLLAGSVSNLIAMYLLLAPTVTAVTTVMTFGIASAADFSAAITLLGEASLVAKLGLIGLAAGVGIAAGSFVNWLIEGTKVQTWLDSFTNGTLNVLHIKWGVTQDAQDSLTASTQKLSDKLGALGVVIPRGTDSIQAWNSRVVDAAKGSQAYQASIADLAAEHVKDAEATTAVIDILTKANAERQRATAAAEDQKKMTEDLTTSTFKETAAAPALIAYLQKMEASHTAAALVTNVHGKEILATVNALTLEGKAVNPLLQQYADLAEAQAKGTTVVGLANEKLDVQGGLLHSLMDKMSGFGLVTASTADGTLKFSDTTVTAAGRLRAFNDAMNDVSIDIVTFQGHILSLSELASLQIVIDRVTASLDLMKIPLQDVGAKLDFLKTTPTLTVSAAGTNILQQQQAWNQAMDSGGKIIDQISGDMSKMFTAAIGHGKDFWTAFKSMGTNAIAAVTDSFVSIMIKSMLSNWQKTLGDWSDHLKVWAHDNANTLSMAMGGAAIGGALGGTTGAIAGGALGTAAGLIIQGAGKDPTNWVGLAIAGAVALGAAISTLFGSLRQEADKFVQQIQNPFADAIGKVSQALQAAQAAGTLTVQQVDDAKASVAKLWSDFQAQATAAGIVGQQALAQLTPFMTQVINDISGLTQMAQMAEAQKRLPELEKELADVQAQTAEAYLSKLDILNSAISTASGNVDTWRKSVSDLNVTISDAAYKLNDAKYWQQQYTNAISDAANALQNVTNQRASVEQRIADLEASVTKDRLDAAYKAAQVLGDSNAISEAQAALDDFQNQQTAAQAAARLTELQNLQNQLPQIIALQATAEQAYRDAQTAAEASVAAQKADLQASIETAAAQRSALLQNIQAEQDKIAVLNADKLATQSVADAMGFARQSELDKINATIASLTARGTALEAERTGLTALLGVAAQGPDIFARLAIAIAAALNAANVTPTAATAWNPNTPAVPLPQLGTPVGLTSIDGYQVTAGADPNAQHGYLFADGSIVRASDGPAWDKLHGPFGLPGNVIGSFQSGGPTKEGWGYLHDDEFVVPKDGALVGGGGGGDVIFQPGSIVIQAANGRDAAIELITTVERSADIRRRFLRLTANQ